MFKYTKHSLKKIEALLEAQGYKVRYEKGSFQSGYCIVENRKIAVINRFFDTEGRINTLLEILGTIEVDETQFEDPKQLKFYRDLQRMGAPEDSTEEEPTEETAEP
ncbi:MAG TPA: hypothetical protein ENJ88_04980 [Phaeodactylibacter sp.]|nr:hypothetical protein [Phaeodactylibacter sp.]